MTQAPATVTPSIRLITGFVVAGTLICFVAALFRPVMALPATVLLLVIAGCYLTAPIAFELTGDELTVFTRIGSRTFGPVVHCRRVERTIWIGLRLFGNGGIFAGTGFYWSPYYGVFRAYVTTARRAQMLMVETPRQKILISPQDPESFLAACGAPPAADATSA